MNAKKWLASALLATAGLTCSHALAQVPSEDCATLDTSVGNSIAAGTVYSGNFTGSTNDGGSPSSTNCSGGGTGNLTQWWYFQPATSGIYDISMCGSAQSDTHLTINLASDACSVTTNISCNDDACGLGSNLTANLTAGVGYRIRTATFGAVSNGGGYQLLATLKSASAPANDSCATPTPLTIGVNSGTINGATGSIASGGNSCGGTADQNDVYFSYTPAVSGTYVLSLCTGDFDAVMSVHTACPVDATTTNQIASACSTSANPPVYGCGNRGIVLGAALTGGTPYLVRVAGATDITGNGAAASPPFGAFDLILAQPAPPANDTCATAIDVSSSLPYSALIDNLGATDDIDTTCNTGSSSWGGVWWSIVPTSSGTLSLSETGAQDVVWTVFQAANCGALPGTVALCTGTDTPATVPVTSGQQYFILCAAATNTTSRLSSLNVTINVIPAPANDLACNAIDLNMQSFPYSDTQDNTGATDDTPDPGSCNSSSASNSGAIWYKYTTGPNGAVVILNETGSMDTSKQVWTGTPACSTATGLTAVGTATCLDAEGPNTVVLPLANTTYYISISSWSTTTRGSITFVFDVIPSPANDNCASAESIGGLPYGPITLDARGASSENDVSCNTHTSALRSVWYSYTPASNETLVCSETSSNDVVWTVWTGACGSLAEFGCSQNDTAGFNLTGGTTYYIELAMQGSTEPTTAYVFSFGNPPSNDTICNATVLTPGVSFPYSESVNAPFATPDADASCNSGTATSTLSGVWYTVTTGFSPAILTVSENGSADTIRAVFSGADCTTATQVSGACSDTETNVSFALAANTQYWILTGMWSPTVPAAVPFDISLDYVDLTPPSNDDCESATDITSSFPYTETVEVRGAFDDLPDVSCNAAANTSTRKGIWYTFTPAVDATLLMNETSSANVVFGVFTGGCASPSEVFCGDNEPSLFAVTAGTPYTILVGLQAATGDPTAALQLAFDLVQPPANDDCANAAELTLPSGSVTVSGQVAAADPDVTCNLSTPTSAIAGVWYHFNPTDDGTILFASTDTNDIVHVVYAGSCGGTVVLCTDTEAGTRIPVTGGTDYYYMVAMWGSSQPTVDYSFTYDYIAAAGACCDGANCSMLTRVDCEAISGATFLGTTVTCDSTLTSTPYNSTDSFPANIPDNTPAGISRTLTIPGSETAVIGASGIAVTVNVNHTWVGDVICTISNGTVTADLIRRPGVPASTVGESDNLAGTYVFVDGGADLPANAASSADSAHNIPPGNYSASSGTSAVSLGAAFNGQPLAGTWTLSISDNATIDTGVLSGFAVQLAQFGSGPCTPTQTPCQKAASYAGDTNLVEVGDLFAFLDLWFLDFPNGAPTVAQPNGDFDGDSDVDVSDLFQFLDEWFAAFGNGGVCA